jgi:hypothetical protein
VLLLLLDALILEDLEDRDLDKVVKLGDALQDIDVAFGPNQSQELQAKQDWWQASEHYNSP